MPLTRRGSREALIAAAGALGAAAAVSLPGLARAADLGALACSGACWAVGDTPAGQSEPAAVRVAD